MSLYISKQNLLFFFTSVNIDAIEYPGIVVRQMLIGIRATIAITMMQLN